MIEDIARKAKEASILMAALDGPAKNNALGEIGRALADRHEYIAQANQADVDQAQRDDLSSALLKRLKFDQGKLQEVLGQIASLIKLDDPVGRTLDCTELDDRLELYRVSCPIGVLGVVFESRPDALVQISTLALKSGNAVLLKGGSEAARTNVALAEVICQAGDKAGLPAGWLGLLETREDVKAMLGLDESIDLIVPRGSNAFVQNIMANTSIAVLGHADGICHVYVDGKADLAMAERIAFDSKCQYAAVCNAMETLLVDAAIAGEFMPRMKARFAEAKVELRGDARTQAIIDVKLAAEQDWCTEYNDLVLSVKVVDGLDAAIEHINRYSSRHTDAIVTEDRGRAERFLQLVDSADVFWNCSTRFADGFRYGLGAEVGISTGKIHARGPVGLEGLITYKWLMMGNGQVVADYAGAKGKAFTHRRLHKNWGSAHA